MEQPVSNTTVCLVPAPTIGYPRRGGHFWEYVLTPDCGVHSRDRGADRCELMKIGSKLYLAGGARRCTVKSPSSYHPRISRRAGLGCSAHRTHQAPVRCAYAKAARSVMVPKVSKAVTAD